MSNFRKSLIVVALISAAFVATAMAADQPINCSGPSYDPANVVVRPGDSVTWGCAFSSHPLVSDEGLWTTVSTGPTFTHPYALTEGTFRFHCSFHGVGAGSMKGSVIVSSTAATGPTGDVGGDGSGSTSPTGSTPPVGSTTATGTTTATGIVIPPPDPTDKTAPVVAVKFPRQSYRSIRKSKAVRLVVTLNEFAFVNTWIRSSHVKHPGAASKRKIFAFDRARTLPAGKHAITVKLNKLGVKAFTNPKRSKRLKVEIEVVATDPSDNEISLRKIVFIPASKRK